MPHGFKVAPMNGENIKLCVEPLLAWYDEHKRDLPWRKTTAPYAVWVSEIMLQQTRVAAVLPYYERWMRELPDVSALADADEERLMKLWQGLGYYSRARNLQKAAQMIVSDFSGVFPSDYNTLLKLPGVGEYTAAAVASIAFGEKVSAVDGNLLRVAARIENIRDNILDGKVKKTIRTLLEDAMPADRPGEFNQALMDLGATVCLPSGAPLCGECPLSPFCAARKSNTAAELPVRTKKSARRIEDMTVYLLLRDGKVALRKRPDVGLLAGLWEFPHTSGHLEDEAAGIPLTQWGLIPRDWKKKITAKHIFTHVEWHMIGYLLTVSGTDTDDLVWADRSELESYAIPGAFQKYYAECIDALQCE